MSVWNHKLSVALKNRDREGVALALGKGAMIINTDNLNTLNHVIVTMLHKPITINAFDLNFIEYLFSLGFKMSIGNNANHILSVIIWNCKNYLRKYQKTNPIIARKNITGLFKLVIENENFKFSPKSLTKVIYDIEILELITEALKPDPMNDLSPESRLWQIFVGAIELHNPQTIKIICESGIKPDIGHIQLVFDIMIKMTDKNHEEIKELTEIVEIMCTHGAVTNPINKIDESLIQIMTKILSVSVRIKNVKIIELMINYGVEPNQSHTSDNTLSCAVKTGETKIIDMVLGIGAEPNQSQTDSNTLSLAVETRNIVILQKIYEVGGLPNVTQSFYNSLFLAMLTMNPGIISIVIQSGGVPTDGKKYMWKHEDAQMYHENIFREMVKKIYLCQNQNESRRITNLLMCSGAKMDPEMLFPRIESYNNIIPTNLLISYYLLTDRVPVCGGVSYVVDDDEVKELKLELSDTMRQIEEEYACSRFAHSPKNIAEQIDLVTHKLIPVPCVEIICGYTYPIKFIDWMNLSYDTKN